MKKDLSNTLELDSDKIVFDEVGPEFIFEVYNPKLGYRGVIVIDNRNLGVAKGGFRMTPEVTIYEVSRLARGMTLKNALAGLPFGGGKGGIRVDAKKLSQKEKKAIVQDFAKKLKSLIPDLYISGPDINTPNEVMEWFAESHGAWHSITGKPADYCTGSGKDKKCGLPHELGSTGYGVVLSAVVAAKNKKINIKGATVAIAGYGNVGQFAHKFLEERGANVVAISDSSGVLLNPKGLHWQKEWLNKNQKRGKVTSSKNGKVKSRDSIYEMKVDILIPAAGSDVVNDKNVKKVKAKIIVEGANIPMKPRHEAILHKKGILVIPDIIANSGGVISSYAELKGLKSEKMFKLIEEKITPNVRAILRTMKAKKILPRDAALKIAHDRVLKASNKKK